MAFTLAGALLTAVVAGALAFPVPGVTAWDNTGDSSGSASTGAPQATADVPTPNPDFTPAVQTQAGYEDEEHEEHEDEDEREEERDDGHEGDEK